MNSTFPLCDFCSNPRAPHTYAADNFIMQELVQGDMRLTHESVGHWAACDMCAELIDSNQWETLIERVLNSQGIPIASLERRAIHQVLEGTYARLRESHFRKIN